MAIIETNWDVRAKDLRLFSAIGLVVFGALAAGKLAEIGFLARYADKLFSWPLLAVAAGLCLIGTNLRGVPAAQKTHGMVGALVCLGLAAALYFGAIAPHAWVFVGLAAYFALGLVAATGIIQPVYYTALVATFPIGLVLGPVILAIIFYGLFTPVALFFKLIGRDTMHRRFDEAAPTYWIERRTVTDVKRYFRQS